MTQLTDHDWEEISQLFEQAANLEPAERAAFLATLDPIYRAEIESLLKFHQSELNYLETSIATHFPLPVEYDSGTEIGDFVIARKLGAGSFGVVYLALQTSLQRSVALKISPNLGDEARTMATLEHDSIVKVFSEVIDSSKNLRVICMQYIGGATLAQVLAHLRPNARLDGPALLRILDDLASLTDKADAVALREREKIQKLNPLELLLQIGVQLADALSHAHQRGILHLDIKPENILFNLSGRAYLTDFNISSNRHSPSYEVFGGTVDYMAPEHLAALKSKNSEDRRNVTQQSDLYSLGIVLKQILLKIPGHAIDSKNAWKHLSHILDRCIEPSQTSRLESVDALSDLLLSCLEYESMEKTLPKAGFFTQLANRFPRTILILSILIPQFFGSFINISYNSMRIVSNLSPAQEQLFRELIFIVNPIVYGICVFATVLVLFPLFKFLKTDGSNTVPADLKKLRKLALRYPVWIAAIATFGWWSCAFFFPGCIHWAQGPITPSVFGHFLVSFALSWLIATTYSYLYSQYFSLRILYPRLWIGTRAIHVVARQELSGVLPRIQIFQVLAGITPLAALALMVFIGPESLSGPSYSVYLQILAMIFLIAVFGVIFAGSGGRQLTETVFALTRKRS